MTSKPFIVGCVLVIGVLTPPAAAQFVDCNGNGVDDPCDLDCGVPGGPCDVPGCGASADCNANSIPDECDIFPFTQQAKLTAADAAGGDQFGWSVSISGDMAAIGAYRDDDACPADPLCESGSAYVFVRTGAVWNQHTKLTAADAAANALFGYSVSINGDTAVIGSPYDDEAGTDSGSVYMFSTVDCQADGIPDECQLAGNDCNANGIPDDCEFSQLFQQAKLTADDAAAIDYFGFSVSISGNTAVIGANLDDDAGVESGSAYVFVRSGTVWIQQAKLTAADATALDEFGRSVSISGDTVVIGARGDDDAGPSSGSAYVYVRNGTVWTQQAKLTAADAAAADEFGSSVSISGDTAVIGTP
ncbi:MAG: FG-GAP repeat protein, partial [Phycisphaerae bacterium]